MKRKFTIVYDDFIESDLLNHYEKAVFIALKKYANNNTMKAFPSLNKLHKVTGISLSQVRRSIDHMKQLGIVSVEHRTDGDKGHQSNLYTLYDYAEIWNIDNSENIDVIVEKISEIKLIAEFQSKGYTVMKEKGLESDTDQSTDTSTINYDLSENNHNTGIKKNQGEITEKYTLDYLKENLHYADMIQLNPYDVGIIDTFFHYLHNAINTTKDTIRIAGQDKPSNVVISVLLKLEYYDFLYMVQKYKENTTRIINQGAYIITLLYNAKAQCEADLTNQVHHDLYGCQF